MRGQLHKQLQSSSDILLSQTLAQKGSLPHKPPNLSRIKIWPLQVAVAERSAFRGGVLESRPTTNHPLRPVGMSAVEMQLRQTNGDRAQRCRSAPEPISVADILRLFMATLPAMNIGVFGSSARPAPRLRDSSSRIGSRRLRMSRPRQLELGTMLR